MEESNSVPTCFCMFMIWQNVCFYDKFTQKLNFWQRMRFENLIMMSIFIAVEMVEKGQFGVAIGTISGKIKAIDLKEALNTPNTFDSATYEINNSISI